MYRSIAISGPIASGTTTAARAVAQKLNLPYTSAGDFFRQYAIDHKIPLHQGVPDDVDLKMDEELQKLVDGGIVLDSHYAGYFSRNKPHVLRVLLICDWNERVKRATTRTHTHTETKDDLAKREESLDKKFRKLYADENYLDPKFFDLVIDTTNTTIEKTVNKIIENFRSNN